MAPTSQSGIRSKNDRIGPERPGEFRSGFRSALRANFVWPEVKAAKHPREAHFVFRSPFRFCTGRNPRPNPLQHVCK
eukprot:6826431-Pyramimonas_sp.AAC.1